MGKSKSGLRSYTKTLNNTLHNQESQNGNKGVLRSHPLALKELVLARSGNIIESFIFYPISSGKISTYPYIIREIIKDTTIIDESIIKTDLDIATISFHTYSYVKKHYRLSRSGAIFGYKTGPILAGRKMLDENTIKTKTIAIPSTLTTAFLLLRLALGDINYIEIPEERIESEIASGKIDAGLFIFHPQQLHIKKGGPEAENGGKDTLRFYKLLDLGRWWFARTSFPVPIRAIGINKRLGRIAQDIVNIIRDSIIYSLDNQENILDKCSSDLKNTDRGSAKALIEKYINEWTIDIRQDGKEAVAKLIALAEERKLIPPTLPVEYIEYN